VVAPSKKKKKKRENQRKELLSVGLSTALRPQALPSQPVINDSNNNQEAGNLIIGNDPTTIHPKQEVLKH